MTRDADAQALQNIAKTVGSLMILAIVLVVVSITIGQLIG